MEGESKVKYFVIIFALFFVGCTFDYNTAYIKYVNETNYPLQMSHPQYFAIDGNDSIDYFPFSWVKYKEEFNITIRGTLFTHLVTPESTTHVYYYTRKEILAHDNEYITLTVKYDPLLLDYVFIYTKE